MTEKKYEGTFSTCCGAKAKSNGDSDTKDLGVCPECLDQCDYEDQYEEDEINEGTTNATNYHSNEKTNSNTDSNVMQQRSD